MFKSKILQFSIYIFTFLFLLIFLLVSKYPVACSGGSFNFNAKISATTENIPKSSPIIPETKAQSRKIITAKGIGKLSPNMPPAQARAMARRAAIADAQRNLLKAINMNIKEVKNNIMVERINYFIKNAKIISERELANGSFEVEMSVTIN